MNVVLTVTAAHIADPLVDAALPERAQEAAVSACGYGGIRDGDVVSQPCANDHRRLEEGVRRPATVRPQLGRPAHVEAERNDEFLVIHAARRTLRRDEPVDRPGLEAAVGEGSLERFGLQSERALPKIEAERVARPDADDAGSCQVQQ
jgi:hypothetical protein